MPGTVIKISIVDIPDSGGDIDVSVTAGHAQLHQVTLELLSTSGLERTIASPAANRTRYLAGSPTQLLKGREVSCAGSIARSSTGGDSAYHVICDFFQGHRKVGSSAPVQGSFGDGVALLHFVILCRFK